jgi:opacity protein-like surface antigen
MHALGLQCTVNAKELVMSRKLLLLAASVAILAGGASFAQAADILEPQVVELPDPVMPVAAPAKGGWYIRGDIGYSGNSIGDVEYDVFGGTPAAFGKALLLGKLRSGYSVGAGVGYDTGNYLRLDLTADYFSKTKFSGNSSCGTPLGVCTDDTANLQAISLLANAYVDIGKYNGITPYVGAGIGGTHVQWGTLNNVCRPGVPAALCATDTHPGATNWRFTYAVMAGASYDVSDCVAIDAGYRFRKVEGGKMFGIAASGAPGGGHDKGIKSHEFRVGARYKFGGCGASHMPDYQPDYQPVYK